MFRGISKNRFISLALLLAFFTISLTAVAHTHKMATKAPEHCNLCQAGHQIRTVDTPVLQKAFVPIVQETTIDQVPSVICSFVFSSLNLSRAPPLA